jgi:hypothetical protein
VPGTDGAAFAYVPVYSAEPKVAQRVCIKDTSFCTEPAIAKPAVIASDEPKVGKQRVCIKDTNICSDVSH